MEDQLEKKIWKRVKFNFIFSPYIWSHPPVWNEKTKAVEPVSMHSAAFLHWCLNITLAFLYCAFVQCRSVQLFLDFHSSTIECLLTQLMAIYHVTGHHVTDLLAPARRGRTICQYSHSIPPGCLQKLQVLIGPSERVLGRSSEFSRAVFG